ncbi:MAG: efflux RND transporter periplasmic adaptor subunit [Pseudomonadota bacterium]
MKKLLLITLSAAFIASFSPGCKEKETESATKQAQKKAAANVVKVKTGKPQVTTISHILNYTGTMQPVQEVRISPETMGKIKKIYVEEGDNVKKGQLLISFDTQLSVLQKGQAQSAVQLAQVQVETMEKEVNRLKPLVDSGAISAGEFDKVKAQHNGAMAQLNQAQSTVALSGYQLKVSRIKAPFAGTVARKLVNEGEIVAPGSLGLYGMITLMDLSKVVVSVGVGEKDLPYIRKGLAATVKVDAYPAETFTGTVENISPAADPLSKAFPIDIHIPNGESKLKSGMFAKVGILIETRQDTVVVPENAILDEKGVKVLFIVEKNQTVKKVEVTTGISSEGLIEITSGNVDVLKEVVTEGNFGLRDGAKILSTQ